AWIDEHLELPNVDRAVADFRGLVGCDDSPAALRCAARGLIEELFPVGRERVRANALEERSRRALLDREALEAQAGRRVRRRFGVIERARRARLEIAEIARGNGQRENALADAREIDAHRRGSRIGPRLRRKRDRW